MTATSSPGTTPPAAALASEVRRLVEGRPYTVVDETAKAFTVQIDVVDAQWWTLLQRKGLRITFTHRVVVAADGRRYSVRDTQKRLSWEAGIDLSGTQVPRPVIRASKSVATGTIRSKSFGKVVAFDDELRPGVVVDYAFSSGEGNHLIETAAGRLGMTRRMNGVTKFALVMALIGGSSIVIVPVAFLLQHLGVIG